MPAESSRPDRRASTGRPKAVPRAGQGRPGAPKRRPGPGNSPPPRGTGGVEGERIRIAGAVSRGAGGRFKRRDEEDEELRPRRRLARLVGPPSTPNGRLRRPGASEIGNGLIAHPSSRWARVAPGQPDRWGRGSHGSAQRCSGTEDRTRRSRAPGATAGFLAGRIAERPRCALRHGYRRQGPPGRTAFEVRSWRQASGRPAAERWAAACQWCRTGKAGCDTAGPDSLRVGAAARADQEVGQRGSPRGERGVAP